MEKLLKGKSDKVVVIFLFMFLPRLISYIVYDYNYDYGIGEIIGAILVVEFVRYINKPAVEKAKNDIRNVKWEVLLLLIVFIFALRFVDLLLTFKFDEFDTDSKLMSYENIIDSLIIAPITEEIFFRWSLCEICIDENTKIYKKFLFVFFMLILWNYMHSGSLSIIILSVVVLGFVEYMIYFKSKNIWYCIFAHMLANLFVVIASSPLQSKLAILCVNNIFVVVDIMLLFISTCLLFKNMKK